MTTRQLDELLKPWLADMIEMPPPLPCRALQLDSRALEPGDIFIALSGQRRHGREFLPVAAARGAVAALVETDDAQLRWAPEAPLPTLLVPGLGARLGELADRWYGAPSADLQVIGITGTNGKTSCSQYIAQALSHAGTSCGVLGTLGYGLLEQLEPATHTTPDAIRVHGLLDRLQRQGAAAVAMEVSSHGLEQGRVNGVRFDTAVFTNLSRDHLDYHGTMRAYGDAKCKLFRMPGLCHAVVNLDDPYAETILATLNPRVERLTYGLDAAHAAIAVEEVRLLPQGMQATVRTPWGRGQLETALLGRFNLSNLLACLAVLGAHGLPLTQALAALSRLQPVTGRMQRLGGDGAPHVIIDYAHTPDALENALRAIRAHCQGRVWCVFGCGGDRDRGKRPLMGEVAARWADRLILTDDNPRTEPRQRILDDIAAGIPTSAEYDVIADRAQAIAAAIQRAAPDDLVLIAGKGHEDYQEINGVRHPFSDIEEARRALLAWNT